MKKLLLILTLASCESAEKTAVKLLGPEVICISSSSSMAYCTVGPNGFLCDTDKCVPVDPRQAERVMMLLDNDRQRSDDETAMLLMQQQQLMLLQ